MDRRLICCLSGLVLAAHCGLAEPTNIAEDDAAQSGYGGNWGNEKNGGSGFGAWVTTSDGTGADQHAGFFIADTSSNSDLNGIAKDGKAFGLFANGAGFEQAVAYRSLNKPLAVGDSFSFMMETGGFEKKSEKENAGGGAIGLVLRAGNANSSPADYNKGAMFEFGHYQGTTNYQIHDGTAKTDSGVAFNESGVVVTVTVTGDDTYDLEIQTAKDKNLTKLPGRKFSSAGSVESLAVFNRNGEKHDAYFNGFQVSRDSP